VSKRGAAWPPPDHRRCTATSHRSGQRCKKWAIKGGCVCSFHGGWLPRVRAKAKMRVATQHALMMMAGEHEHMAVRLRADLLHPDLIPRPFGNRVVGQPRPEATPAFPPPVRPAPNPEADALSRNAVLRNDGPDDAPHGDQAVDAVDVDQSPRAGVNQPRDAASDAHQEADADGRESTTPPVDADRRSPPASSTSPMSTPLIDEDGWPPRETRWGPR
jgi:hypothetical protein